MSAAVALGTRPRVLLTRSRDDCMAWAPRLREAGFVPVIFPCIRCESLTDAGLGARLRAALGEADWLVFSSRRGVESFARLHPPSLPRQVRVAAVGPATAAVARRALGRVDLRSEGGTCVSMAEELKARLKPVRGSRIVLALAENAAEEPETILKVAGARCTRLALYRTVSAPPRHPRRPFSSLGADAVLLASPSAVKGFLNQVDLDASPGIFTIGPTTSAATRAAGLIVSGEAGRRGLEGLLEVLW